MRREAFDKVMQRLQEKEEAAEKDRAKRHERPSMERHSHRDRDRGDRGDRDRGERSHRPRNRHGRGPSRSPEPDPYEADRRKAIADREKNHRRGNAADSLLSPSRRVVDRIDRERDLDRPHRSRRDSSSIHYDRERRDREDDREKIFKRRADPPRGSNVDELPYGDERPSGSRRRRAESDDVDSVGSKRDNRETKVRRLLSYKDADDLPSWQ